MTQTPAPHPGLPASVSPLGGGGMCDGHPPPLGAQAAGSPAPSPGWALLPSESPGSWVATGSCLPTWELPGPAPLASLGTQHQEGRLVWGAPGGVGLSALGGAVTSGLPSMWDVGGHGWKSRGFSLPPCLQHCQPPHRLPALTPPAPPCRAPRAAGLASTPQGAHHASPPGPHQASEPRR